MSRRLTWSNGGQESACAGLYSAFRRPAPAGREKCPRQEGHGAETGRLPLLPSGPDGVGRRLPAWFLAMGRYHFSAAGLFRQSGGSVWG